MIGPHDSLDSDVLYQRIYLNGTHVIAVSLILVEERGQIGELRQREIILNKSVVVANFAHWVIGFDWGKETSVAERSRIRLYLDCVGSRSRYCEGKTTYIERSAALSIIVQSILTDHEVSFTIPLQDRALVIDCATENSPIVLSIYQLQGINLVT